MILPSRSVVPLLAILLVAPGAAAAASDGAAACKASKARAAGKKAAAILRAFGKNARKPDPARLAASLSKASARLGVDFDRAESKGGCLTTGDAAALQAKVDAFADDVIGIAPPTTTTSMSSTTTTTVGGACVDPGGYPVCNGTCPAAQVCSTQGITMECVCQPGPVGCNAELDTGMCGIGSCPAGTQCIWSPQLGSCSCRFI